MRLKSWIEQHPMAGDLLSVVDGDARAREVSEYRQRVMREKEAASGARIG